MIIYIYVYIYILTHPHVGSPYQSPPQRKSIGLRAWNSSKNTPPVFQLSGDFSTLSHPLAGDHHPMAEICQCFLWMLGHPLNPTYNFDALFTSLPAWLSQRVLGVALICWFLSFSQTSRGRKKLLRKMAPCPRKHPYCCDSLWKLHAIPWFCEKYWTHW